MNKIHAPHEKLSRVKISEGRTIKNVGEVKLFTGETKMKLLCFHIITDSKYSQILGKEKPKNLEKEENLQDRYDTALSNFYDLRNKYNDLQTKLRVKSFELENLLAYRTKEKARRIANIENFCHGRNQK